MTWKFHVCATTQRRMFSRILQVLESQMVEVESLAGEIGGEETRVRFLFSSTQERAQRIKALLYRLEGIRDVRVFAEG